MLSGQVSPRDGINGVFWPTRNPVAERKEQRARGGEQGAESLKSQSSKSEVRNKLRKIRRTGAFNRSSTRGARLAWEFGDSKLFRASIFGFGLRSEEGKCLTSSAERRMERSELP